MADVPRPLRLALVIAIEIILMTYLILPWLIRRLAGWISPSTVTKT
jgi:antibiotic biosynthesis monooxygenase (ABM) superfamily enzyme